MKTQILQLHKEGKSHRQIAIMLGCTRNNVKYHIDESRRLSGQNYSSTPIIRKLNGFKQCRKGVNGQYRQSALNLKEPWGIQEFLQKVGDNPKCYISGRPIALNNTSSWHCDHIIPINRGGSGELDNLGIACAEANIAKGKLSLDEFLVLCKDVLNNFGYMVIPVKQ